MSELTNCPNCGSVFVKNAFRTVCQDCFKEEEKAYEMVYDYMRKRENRAATINQVVEATGVTEELIYKFIKAGRLKSTQFPNLGYPCDRCGRIIKTGKVCDPCQDELRRELNQIKADEERKKEQLRREKSATYFTAKK